MLKPDERAQAVDLLTTFEMNRLNGNIYQAQNVFRYGFAGFATFTDKELLRAVSAAAKQGDYTAQNFISSIAAEKFILE